MNDPAPTVVRGPSIDPAALDPVARTALADELFAVHRQIFDGVDADALRRYVLESEGADTRLQMFYDDQGSAAGYVAVHGFLQEVDGRSTLIARCEVGVARRFRGQASFVPFVLVQAVRLWLRNLGRPKLVFACPVHPSSFWGLTRRSPCSWPRPGVDTPPAITETMHALADRFGLVQTDADRPGVRDVGWITRMTDADRQHWAAHQAPEVEFYRAENPHYEQGQGLLLLLPLDLRQMVVGGYNHVAERARRWWSKRRQRSAAQTRPHGAEP
ncbi:MAG: hypothetical protein AAF799_43095 [Myxococcota bacterium]